jgi:hypothetical protein
MGGYLRPHQIDEITNEKRVIEHTLTNQRDVQDRSNLQAHLRRIDQQIADQAPPDLTGEERDKKVRECREIEERLVPLMPSDEQMRRNTPGTVGQHNRFDAASKSTAYFEEGDIFRWKDNQLALHKGDNDPDIANFERMRPLHNNASMLGAQIEGTQYHGTNPSPAYKAGWDRTFNGGAEPAVDDLPPEERRERKPATRKKATRKKATRRKSAKIEMACGAMKDPRGKRSHEMNCDACQEVLGE